MSTTAISRVGQDLAWLDDLDAERLSLRIGATQETIRRLREDVGEDEMTLALFTRGTPPEDSGFASEDQCAAFVADTQRSITEKQAQLDGLRKRLAALEEQPCPDCKTPPGTSCPPSCGRLHEDINGAVPVGAGMGE